MLIIHRNSIHFFNIGKNYKIGNTNKIGKKDILVTPAKLIIHTRFETSMI